MRGRVALGPSRRWKWFEIMVILKVYYWRYTHFSLNHYRHGPDRDESSVRGAVFESQTESWITYSQNPGGLFSTSSWNGFLNHHHWWSNRVQPLSPPSSLQVIFVGSFLIWGPFLTSWVNIFLVLLRSWWMKMLASSVSQYPMTFMTFLIFRQTFR